MRLLYEKYWQLSSEVEKQKRAEGEKRLKLRKHPRRLNKLEDEYILIDKIV